MIVCEKWHVIERMKAEQSLWEINKDLQIVKCIMPRIWKQFMCTDNQIKVKKSKIDFQKLWFAKRNRQLTLIHITKEFTAATETQLSWFTMSDMLHKKKARCKETRNLYSTKSSNEMSPAKVMQELLGWSCVFFTNEYWLCLENYYRCFTIQRKKQK